MIDLSSMSDDDSAESLAHFIQSSESSASEGEEDNKHDDDDEAKVCDVAYDVSRDATVSTVLDFVPYSDCREQGPQQTMQFYDRKGQLLTSTVAEDMLK